MASKLGPARRATAALLVVGMVTGGVLGLGPPVAAASITSATLASWAYIDTRAPRKSFVDGKVDAPVGAWRDTDDERDLDGGLHVSKSYFTFDLPAIGGARILAAELNAFETSGGDCAQPRATELWLTDTAERPTWVSQPRERVKLPGPDGSPSCPGWVGWDATKVIQETLAAGRTRITLALRMPPDKQWKPEFGRRYANDPYLNIRYNFPPNTPTNLAFDNRPCADTQFQPRGFQERMFATVTDPDDGPVGARFAFWAVDQPDQRYEVSTDGSNGGRLSASAPSSLLADNRGYEWTVRGVDGDGDVSAWAPSCRFTTDYTPPAAPPNVSSVDYPDDGQWHGGEGTPGQFTFTANGVADVAGFLYDPHDFPSTFVATDALGGTATITFTPDRSGPMDLYVRSVDRAGNRGPMQRHHFFVRVTEPRVTSSPPDGGNGVPREFTFTPRLPDVVSYVYRFNNGPETKIAAAEDGTVRVTLTPDRPFVNQLTVRSVSRDGVLSGLARYEFTIQGGEPPRVWSETYPPWCCGGGPGVPGTFFLEPNMPDVVEYVYVYNDGAETILPAGPNGSATMTITPTVAGRHKLVVFSRSADVTVSNPVFYDFDVSP